MTKQKKIHWVIIFTLLTSFTVSAIFGISRSNSPSLALAAVPENADSIVVVSAGALSFADQFRLMREHNRVAMYFCSTSWIEVELLRRKSFALASQGFAVISGADLQNAGLPVDLDCRKVSRDFLVPILLTAQIS